MLSEGIVSAKLIFKYLSKKIKISGVDQNEISSMIYLILEKRFSLSRMEVILGHEINLKKENIHYLEDIIKKLNDEQPVQYILGETEFYGIKLKVTPDVLIPRSETEELVDLIIKENSLPGIQVLDIGTGSGCIAIALQKNLKNARLSAIDVELAALKIAQENALHNDAEVKFLHLDIFYDLPLIQQFDIIVSNPPYVLEKEKMNMRNNVLMHEPHSALFVPDEDPLKFYIRIINLAKKFLKPGGKLYFEINEKLGEELKKLMTEENYKFVEIEKDMQNKNRILKGVKGLNPVK